LPFELSGSQDQGINVPGSFLARVMGAKFFGLFNTVCLPGGWNGAGEAAKVRVGQGSQP